MNFWSSLPLRNELFGDRLRKPIGTRTRIQKHVYHAMRVHLNGIYDHNLEIDRRRRNQQTAPPSSTSKSSSWTTTTSSSPNQDPGGIYNLSFSPNGSALIAATKNRCILVFDPLSHRLVHQYNEAHSDTLNNIRFLNDHLFATCSDDSTISLWDLRMMDQRLRNLRSHTYWVKNIEYDAGRRILVTSGYDGIVNAWNIFKDNRDDSFSRHSSHPPAAGSHFGHPDESCPHKRVFSLSCIMRMRLTHDASKMMVCTSEGFILIIHDLDIDQLPADLENFQCDLYRLMQKGHSFGYDFGSWHNRLFQSRRNRVELISDFPDESHEISSLDVHPHDWAIVSRGITRNDDAEWTVVHDIQDDMKPNTLIPLDLPKDNHVHSYDMPIHNRSRVFSHLVSHSPAVPTVSSSSSPSAPSPLFTSQSSSRSSVEVAVQAVISSVAVASSRSINEQEVAVEVREQPEPPESYMSPVVIISARTMNRRAHATILNPNTSYRQIKQGQSPPLIYQNLKRMSYYAKEPNVGHGYIKELSFSPDGRVIVSPFEAGYRILAFNGDCDEMNVDVGPIRSRTQVNQSKELREVKRFQPHVQNVLTTKFSPTHQLIASGCFGGRVVFTQPMLE